MLILHSLLNELKEEFAKSKKGAQDPQVPCPGGLDLSQDPMGGSVLIRLFQCPKVNRAGRIQPGFCNTLPGPA